MNNCLSKDFNELKSDLNNSMELQIGSIYTLILDSSNHVMDILDQKNINYDYIKKSRKISIKFNVID